MKIKSIVLVQLKKNITKLTKIKFNVVCQQSELVSTEVAVFLVQNSLFLLLCLPRGSGNTLGKQSV